MIWELLCLRADSRDKCEFMCLTADDRLKLGHVTGDDPNPADLPQKVKIKKCKFWVKLQTFIHHCLKV